ncbi:rhoGEF domain-containing protein [Naegleria gruberi]|uniref:RhoGEF domain-containing protein n=1 Tax=Naegleria gruberi TaxID=5762 RepID=D2VSE0_NAEGR|nr:rhoGEF domain-containing protein [Naegleria gruberi]EFC40331.1 rhoGEF domain-containing protein [Naegleria gruberi]|eukprot:XP_002673075.1 rhoGEF domain-containing protein [Naegleria gruberi strain NEG-M]
MRFNLTISQIQKIFNNLSTILSMHRIFLINLEQKLKEWPNVFIGESFMNQSFFFLFYVEYINGYNESSNTLRELRLKNREFLTFLNETKKHKECKGLSLESFLILPIQRLPRYKLLLKGVLKHTLPDHTDYQNLKSAYNRISAINNAINSKKKEHETYLIINKMFNEMKIFSRESPIANTHIDWSKKLYKQLHLTKEDEQINNVKQFEMREILRICDQVFHKFSTTSSLNKLESTVFEEPSPRNSMMKTLSFLKKSPSLTAVKHTEDEEHEVKKLIDTIQVNTEHF